jgi:hypothetical protein
MATARVIRLTGPYPVIRRKFSICTAHLQVENPLCSASGELAPSARQAKIEVNARLTHLSETDPLPNHALA